MDNPIVHQNTLPDNGQPPSSRADDWRTAMPWDDALAYVARKALVELRCYPSGPMDETKYPNLNKDCRARLHEIVDELPLTELWGFYHLGRILLVTKLSYAEMLFEQRRKMAAADVAKYKGVKDGRQ